MNSFQIFREAFSNGKPPGSLFSKPLAPERPLDSAIWRFLNSWQQSENLGADEAVLFRQVARWGAEGTNVKGVPTDFKKLLKNCSVMVDANSQINANAFKPDWILNDTLPTEGIDVFPEYRQDRHRLKAEQYLGVLQRCDGIGGFQGFDQWKSAAQKEGAWTTVTAEPGSTNLVVLPTGMGKSLCFQLLPVFSAGLTVVVVPTIALAIDQWRQAQAAFKDRKDVVPVYFAANDPDIDPALVVDLINEGKTRLVFTSPEACVSGRLNYCLNNAARKGVLENLIIDEAHLVSSWGMYFRVDFQLLSGLRRKWKTETQGKLRTFLYTATITPEQKVSILDQYSEVDSICNEFLFHSLRPELSYYDQLFEHENQQQHAMLDCLWHLPRPAIIYTTEVNVAEQIHRQAGDLGFRRVGCFTGRTRAFDRRTLLEQWRRDEFDLMVATSAFGLGVDKADVRSVIHCCMPEDLNRYYQEVGRGGRDGFRAISILIPTEKDISVAKGMKPKLMSTELVQKRWSAMWETREEIDFEQHKWKLCLHAKRYGLLGGRTYQENVKWNERLVLQLARAKCIEIENLFADEEVSAEFGERLTYVNIRLSQGFNPDSSKVGHAIEEQRMEELNANNAGYRSLLDHLDSKKCLSRILKRLYGDETKRCCGGCRWCRNEDRDPTEAPVFEFKLGNTAGPVQIYEGCEHPITGIKRVFIKTIRRLYESGIRRFACAKEFHSELLELFGKALSKQDLYRLDAIENGLEFELLKPDRLVVFHLEKPIRSLIDIGGTTSISHMLCGDLGFNDIRYLLPNTSSNLDYYSNLDMWN